MMEGYFWLAGAAMGLIAIGYGLGRASGLHEGNKALRDALARGDKLLDLPDDELAKLFRDARAGHRAPRLGVQ